MRDLHGRKRTSAASRHKSTNKLRSGWCCSFSVPPSSPDVRSIASNPAKSPVKKTTPYNGSMAYSSPSPSRKLGIIDPRRILSPGRVSPLPEVADHRRAEILVEEEEGEEEEVVEIIGEESGLDLKMRVRGRDGKEMVMEMESRVLTENSLHFKEIVMRKKEGEVLEVDDVDDLIVFKETIEMMYEVDLMAWLMKVGVSRSIDVLELSSKIKYDRGVASCLTYIEAVPWTETEEEKLKQLLTTHKFDPKPTQDILARLQPEKTPETPSQNLAANLIQSISSSSNTSARKELQSLLSALLSKSSIYQKAPALDKSTLYNFCNTSLHSLIVLFEENSNRELISKEVENLNWILELLIEKQMAEDFVQIWGSSEELVRLHGVTSPMVRYELSRISATIFTALGKGRIRCNCEVRFGALNMWFAVMVLDFGWLRRCSKGLDLKGLEEGLGQALLTLPLKQQQGFFMEWVGCFGVSGSEGPDLSKAFQVWWRRSFANIED